MSKKKILLHTCCAPCISYVYELLHKDYDITAYYYNPNIAPASEYEKRLKELIKFSKLKSFPLIVGEYDIAQWTARVKEFRYLGEGSQRCWYCYEYRIEETFKKAKELNFDAVSTVLSISPHKNAEWINSIGKKFQDVYDIEFIEANFKKNNGYKKSTELSKEYGFYRQDYCGCVYSRMERNPDSAWSKRSLKERMIDFGDEVDLHYFHPRDTATVVNEFIRQAVENGLSGGRIIHGKGKSQKKMHIHDILSSSEYVAAFNDDGSNWGATRVQFVVN